MINELHQPGRDIDYHDVQREPSRERKGVGVSGGVESGNVDSTGRSRFWIVLDEVHNSGGGRLFGRGRTDGRGLDD